MKKTVLVVGAAGGVGLQLTQLLVEGDYDVIGTVLDETQATQVKKQVPGVKALVQLDLSNADSIAPTLTPVLSAPNVELAAAVVCAAISPQGPLETAPLDSFRKVFEINTIAGVAVYQTCMPFLRKTQGRLLLMSSHGGCTGIPFIGQYVASKFALEGLGDVMRREAAKFGVPVIIVEPGALQTSMTFGQLELIDKDIAALQAEERELYGDLYKGFQGIIKGAIAAGTEPSVVAEGIVSALETEQPQTRYQIGQDAIDLVAMAKTASDVEIDALYANIFAQAAAATDGEVSENILDA